MEQWALENVRKTVWPWEKSVQRPERSLLRVVLVQVVVMTLIASLFWWFEHRVMSGVVVGLAGFFLVLASVWPVGYWTMERLFLRFGVRVGAAMTYVLLVPFFFLCFVPAHLFLRLAGKDPMRLRFPAKADSCWRTRPPHAATDPYRRQY